MVDIIKSVLVDKYASISGRANRTEFWVWQLFNLVLNIVLGVLSLALSSIGEGAVYVGGVLSVIVGLALLIPNICVAVRRLHDTGRGGGWWFIIFVPLVGWIWFLVLMLLPGEPQSNRFGEVPTTSL